MERIAPTKKLFANLHHIGIIVEDVDKAAEEYESLGIGPFEPLVVEGQRWARGKFIKDYKLKNKLARLGPTRIELIQPVSGKGSLHEEFLQNKGGGIHHMAFAVDDIEEAEREMTIAGYTQVFKSRFQNGGGAAYFSNEKPDAAFFEFFQRPQR